MTIKIFNNFRGKEFVSAVQHGCKLPYNIMDFVAENCITGLRNL